jgi:hypothetical protein
MRKLLVHPNALGTGLFWFMPASESLRRDSMQNLVSRSFLFSLWWKELTCLGVLICLALFVVARVAFRETVPRRVASGPTSTDPAERLNELTEQR